MARRAFINAAPPRSVLHFVRVQPLTADEVAGHVVRLHRKHAEEVTGVMESALASHSTQILEEKLPTTCAIILAFPGKYRTVPVATKTEEVPRPFAKLKSTKREEKKIGPYSERDNRVFGLVGEPTFKVLTNDEIEKRFRPKLREIWGRKNHLSANALRSCLNRIRRHYDFPRSEAIHKKAVNQ